MRKVVLYGAGELTKNYLKNGTNDYEIVAILDRQWERIKALFGHKVVAPENILQFEFEFVIIALDDLKRGMDKTILEVYQYLQELGVKEEKIILQSFKSLEHHIRRFPRKVYLMELSEMMRKNHIYGDVAECGVYRGWFASMINESFPNETLWLFDTFSGFDERDIEADVEPAQRAIREGMFDKFNETSEVIVKLRCMHRDKIKILKGYVPDSFSGIDTKFCFVNLDMDLYVPQLAALEYFSDRMVKGGVILVHDYYNEIFAGTAKAVDAFCAKKDMIKYPIGDGLSLALLF